MFAINAPPRLTGQILLLVCEMGNSLFSRKSDSAAKDLILSLATRKDLLIFIKPHPLNTAPYLIKNHE
jgi:hypothetical protein